MDYQKISECRFCKGKLVKVVNLGKIPPVNFFPIPDQAARIKKFPIILSVCSKCELLQLSSILKPQDLFEEYHYLTAASKNLVEDLNKLAEYCIKEFNLGRGSRVLDIGSNDGSFLEGFVKGGILAVGIDPGKEVSAIAAKKGIKTIVKFFNLNTAVQIKKKYGGFDLITSIHNFANIPDINDFLEGIRILMRPSGVLVIEVADARKMVEEGRFDSVYHEHYNYFTLPVLKRIVGAHGLGVFKVMRNRKQGGSIRVFARHTNKVDSGDLPAVRFEKYEEYALKVHEIKKRLLKLFGRLEGKKVVGYGAPAKAVVLANLLGLNSKKIDFIIDSTGFKKGKLLPGTDIPVFGEDYFGQERFEYVFVFAWNFKGEIIKKLSKYAPVKVIVPFPEMKIVNIRRHTPHPSPLPQGEGTYSLS